MLWGVPGGNSPSPMVGGEKKGSLMSYLQILVGRGCPAVGLSADWAESAVRTEGNQWSGEVVMECGGMLSRLAYAFHDGDLADEVAEVEIVPDLTPAVFAAYCVACGEYSPGNVDPVGALESAARAVGLPCLVEGEPEHVQLIPDVAAVLDGWYSNGWRLSEVDATDLACMGAVSLGEGRNGLEAIGADGEPMAFLTAGLWLDSSGRNLLP